MKVSPLEFDLIFSSMGEKCPNINYLLNFEEIDSDFYEYRTLVEKQYKSLQEALKEKYNIKVEKYSELVELREYYDSYMGILDKNPFELLRKENIDDLIFLSDFFRFFKFFKTKKNARAGVSLAVSQILKDLDKRKIIEHL